MDRHSPFCLLADGNAAVGNLSKEAYRKSMTAFALALLLGAGALSVATAALDVLLVNQALAGGPPGHIGDGLFGK
jgi:hypothetical protein